MSNKWTVLAPFVLGAILGKKMAKVEVEVPPKIIYFPLDKSGEALGEVSVDEIKNKLKEDVERIEEDLRLALNAKTYDFHTSMIVKNKALRRVAEQHLNGFVEKLMAELDMRGIYMEYKGREVEVGFSHTWLKRKAHT